MPGYAAGLGGAARAAPVFGYEQVCRRGGLAKRKLYFPFDKDPLRPPTPILCAWSPSILPPSKEWPSQVHVTGYYFFDTDHAYQPPAELQKFLDAGESPICVSFGSMVNRDAERIDKVVRDALAQTNNRGIILSGWSTVKNNAIDNLLYLDAVPHDWLLPRCKMIIHHGGAGTTSAGLRAGIPHVVVPFTADQPFWGKRVHTVGAGPKPILVKKLSVVNLIHAIAKADDHVVRKRAQDIGQRIGREDGVMQAVELIESHTSPLILLAAPAGRGKSAMLVRWLDSLKEREDLALAFVPVSIRFGTNMERVFYAALAARLAFLHGDDVPASPETSTAVYRGLVSEYLSKPLANGRTLLIVLDGLDEAADWQAGADFMPSELPAGVRVVVSARFLAGDADSTPWLRRLNWERNGLASAPSLNPLNQDGVRGVLFKMGCPGEGAAGGEGAAEGEGAEGGAEAAAEEAEERPAKGAKPVRPAKAARPARKAAPRPKARAAKKPARRKKAAPATGGRGGKRK